MNTRTFLSPSPPRARIDLPTPAAPDTTAGAAAPALAFMVDFRRTRALSVSASVPIDDALRYMLCAGVRFLFVVDPGPVLVGSITSYDIQSEKPTQHLQSQDCRISTCSRGDVQVRDIMIPVMRWRVVRYGDLVQATLGDMAQTFRNVDQRHIVVVEPRRREGGGDVVRGLLSATDVERALGSAIVNEGGMGSFAEIARVLAG